MCSSRGLDVSTGTEKNCIIPYIARFLLCYMKNKDCKLYYSNNRYKMFIALQNGF